MCLKYLLKFGSSKIVVALACTKMFYFSENHFLFYYFQLIGRNVGQLFKKEVFILDLPTMNIPKEKPRSAVDSSEGAGLENLFNNTNAPT